MCNMIYPQSKIVTISINLLKLNKTIDIGQRRPIPQTQSIVEYIPLGLVTCNMIFIVSVSAKLTEWSSAAGFTYATSLSFPHNVNNYTAT